jgi:hypothetical protein
MKSMKVKTSIMAILAGLGLILPGLSDAQQTADDIFRRALDRSPTDRLRPLRELRRAIRSKHGETARDSIPFVMVDCWVRQNPMNLDSAQWKRVSGEQREIIVPIPHHH